MAQKVMLEATADVVDGNVVAHPAGALYGSLKDVPEGVPVRPVLTEVPDDPEAAPKAEPAKAEPAKAAAKASPKP